MVITFPHMGKAYIAVKTLFEELGVEVVVPPPINKKTLEVGTKLSPEMACLPLKINLGNYLDSIQKGADTIILTGSCGPCRFGYYGVVQKEILKDLGFDVEVIILDPPNGDIKGFLGRIQKAAGGCSWNRVLRAFRNAYRIAQMTDELFELGLKKRPRELQRGETDKLLNEFEEKVVKVTGAPQTLKIIREYEQRLDKIQEHPNADPLRIGIIGEIYTVIEPFVNMNVEKKLGLMGVEVHRGLTVGEWIKTHLSFDLRYKIKRKKLLRKAEPYLDRCIGGHAWETVANAVHFAEQGFDGIVQILPFGCMPEIVAESILPKVSEDMGVPILTLTVDEMTGEAGYLTRLEAFVDLAGERKGNKQDEQNIVFGY